MLSDLHVFHLILFHLFVLTLAMKLKDVSYKSHWNILVICDWWKIDVGFEYVSWKASDFVLFPVFGFILIIKLGNFDFESHWNSLIFFDKKKHDVRFEYVSWKK